MQAHEVIEKVDARCKNFCLIDYVYIHYIATGSTFIPCSKELQPDTTRTRIPN